MDAIEQLILQRCISLFTSVIMKAHFDYREFGGGSLQLTMMVQVTIARVYNWDVHQRRTRQVAAPMDS